MKLFSFLASGDLIFLSTDNIRSYKKPSKVLARKALL